MSNQYNLQKEESLQDYRKRLDGVYRDLDLSLPVHPMTKNIKPITGVKAVNKAIKNLIFSNKWDYPFDPDIYGGINQMLFEHASAVYFSHVQTRIKDILKTYEPRIEVDDVLIEWIDEQSIAINIHYQIIAIDKKETTRIILKRER